MTFYPFVSIVPSNSQVMNLPETWDCLMLLSYTLRHNTNTIVDADLLRRHTDQIQRFNRFEWINTISIRKITNDLILLICFVELMGIQSCCYSICESHWMYLSVSVTVTEQRVMCSLHTAPISSANLSVWTAWPCGSCWCVCTWAVGGEEGLCAGRSRAWRGTPRSHSRRSRCPCAAQRWLLPRMPHSPPTWPASPGHEGSRRGSSWVCLPLQMTPWTCLCERKQSD